MIEETLTPEEAWDRLVVQKTDDVLGNDRWVGRFFREGTGVSFDCPDGCCYDHNETKEEFLRMFKGETFFVKEKAPK